MAFKFSMLAWVLTTTALASVLLERGLTERGLTERGLSCKQLNSQGHCGFHCKEPEITFLTLDFYHKVNGEFKEIGYIPYQEHPGGKPGCYGCGKALKNGPIHLQPIYAKVRQPTHPDAQLFITETCDCPLNGPGGAIYGFGAGSHNKVKMTDLTGEECFTLYPAGGSNIPTLALAPDETGLLSNKSVTAQLEKRADDDNIISWDSAEIRTRRPSQTPPKKMSAIVDCRHSDSPCNIAVADQHATNIQYSITINGGLKLNEALNIAANFGGTYTKMESVTTTHSHSVDAHQRGYLAAYAEATEFKGNLYGCDDQKVHPYVATIPKKNAQSYRVIYIN